MGKVQKTILVRQIKSVIGVPDKQRKIVLGLGLNGIGKERVHNDNNCIRGMVNKVSHLVSYQLNPKG